MKQDAFHFARGIIVISKEVKSSFKFTFNIRGSLKIIKEFSLAPEQGLRRKVYIKLQIKCWFAVDVLFLELVNAVAQF